MKGIRELYQRNVNRCKKIHEVISRKGHTSTQPEERDMYELEIDEVMGPRGRDTVGQDYTTGCKLRANFEVAVKALPQTKCLWNSQNDDPGSS